MQPDSNKLSGLRDQILDNLVSMSDQLAVNDNVNYEALIVLGRTTGRQEFLEKAYEKIQAIEDGSERADALLDLLDEVEAQISEQDSQPETPEEENQEAPTEPQAQPQN